MESCISLHLILKKQLMKTIILIAIIALASCKSNEKTMNVPKPPDCVDCPEQGKTFQGQHGGKKNKSKIRKKD
jgi:hypothetical protein